MTRPDQTPRPIRPEELRQASGGSFNLDSNEGGAIRGTAGADEAYGRGGNDFLDLAGGNDLGYGGDGNDTIQGGEGDDELHGQGGNDFFITNVGQDTAYGGAGDDTYYWTPQSDGGDAFHGGPGNDTIMVPPWTNLTTGMVSLDNDVTMSMKDGVITFSGPASGTLQIAGQTLSFTSVSTIRMG